MENENYYQPTEINFGETRVLHFEQWGILFVFIPDEIIETGWQN